MVYVWISWSVLFGKKNINMREGDENTQAVETNLPVALLLVEVKGLFALSITHV